MIQPTYVTFKQAKLLAEKNFNEELNTVYNLKSEPTKSHYNTMKNSDIEAGTICTRPEQWVVVEWLRVTHGIWIEVFKQRGINAHLEGKGYNFIPLNLLDGNNTGVTIDEKGYSTPQEAYSAAFDYILTNLI